MDHSKHGHGTKIDFTHQASKHTSNIVAVVQRPEGVSYIVEQPEGLEVKATAILDAYRKIEEPKRRAKRVKAEEARAPDKTGAKAQEHKRAS